MEKTFDAAEAEPRIYEKWETAGAFAAGANASRPETFSIVIPPPNVTGSLHMGHALNNTLQDVLIRWKRMQGYDVLWQPGTDHAGIATQMVVERALAAEGNESRREMGRDRFVERVWQQKRESEGTILGQLKRLGCSCDWSRTRFTMDEGLSAAVLKVFVDLYDKGLIFRGKRLVNWDPQFETAISDLEVENVEVDGHMWHFRYPLAADPETGQRQTYEYVEKDADGNVTLRETRDYISIATTRPETMLGDGAVAVHPSDQRYAPIVGKLCEIPVGPKEHRRLIPIITDDYPDPEFGSGAVKITGAHDFNDYAVARRGGIPCYRLMDTKAHMRDDGEPYADAAALALSVAKGERKLTEAEADQVNLVPDDLRGLDRYAARARVIRQITEEGLAVMVPAGHPEVAWMKGCAPEWDDTGRVRSSAPQDVPGQARDSAATAADHSDAVPGEDPGPQTLPLVESRKIIQPFGDRSKVVIEPMLTDQWFVDAKTLAQAAIEAVHDGRTKFVPDNWSKVYDHWMENIEPWCISRQLWWGHQIPVWYGPSLIEGMSFEYDGADALTNNPKRLFCAHSENEAIEQAKEYYGTNVDIKIVADFDDATASGQVRSAVTGGAGNSLVLIQRDPDVLDTWFSSALWPFSTLGWPDETPELVRYYKTDVLITGFDIIFFWVARMMMQGIEFMGEVPFHTVYINSIVVDGQGKKMSKSLGNILDPLEMIGQYGADATRFALASQEVQARRTLRMSNQAAEGGQRFGTKLWNAARFAEMNQAYGQGAPATPPAATQTVNRWIIGETARAAAAVTAALEGYRFNEAATEIYDHVWKVFCDWYVEFAKPLLMGEDEAAKAETRATMAWALDQCLILLHPIMPFITEELWETLTTRSKPLIHMDWPDLGNLADADADAEIGWVIRVIEGVRSVRAEMNVPAGEKIAMVLTGAGAQVAPRVARNGALIERLARLSGIEIADQAPEGSVTLTLEDGEVNLPLKGVIDIAAEKARLEKAVGKSEKEIKGLEGKLKNQGFLAKAPEEVVEEQRHRLEAARSDRQRLSAALDRLTAMG